MKFEKNILSIFDQLYASVQAPKRYQGTLMRMSRQQAICDVRILLELYNFALLVAFTKMNFNEIMKKTVTNLYTE